MAVCEACRSTFTVSAALAERFPGWSPSRCPRCFDGGGRRPTRRSGPIEDNLTTAAVLARHTGGPTSGVFTDGSATPNPGPGGWGAVHVIDGTVVAQSHGHDPATTNNRMELQALIAGIDLVPPGTPATLYSDSRLAVDTLTTWAAGWRAKGWTRKGGPIKNLDLVKPLFAAFEARPELDIVWIAAHSGHRWNEYADSLSTAWLREEV